MSFESLLTHRGTIQRDTGTTKDPMNNRIANWTNLATEVPGLLQASAGKETVRDGETVISNHLLFLKFGQDITERDRWVQDGKTYDVLFVENAAGQDHHLEVDLKLVGGA